MKLVVAVIRITLCPTAVLVLYHRMIQQRKALCQMKMGQQKKHMMRQEKINLIRDGEKGILF
jgi:hypothetical protein